MYYLYILFLTTGLLCFVQGQSNDAKQDTNIYKPCEPDNQQKCVRNYFHQTGQCASAHHKDGVPTYRGKQISYLPQTNLTVILTQSRIIFYGSKIEKFYVNKISNKLVMAVDFKGIDIECKVTKFLCQRRGMEPVVTEDYLTANYTPTLTAVVPDQGRSMKEASVNAYNFDAYPPFTIGPNFSKSSDPVIANTYKAMLADVPTAVDEIFLTESYNFFMLYLQSYICDFGIPNSIE